MIKEAPADAAEAYSLLLEESKNISTASDLDYLFIRLKGTGSEELIKAIEKEGIEEEKEDDEI